MDVLEAIQKRVSVRAYQDKPVPEEKLRRILEAARLAPSARNSQDYQLIVVKDGKIKKEMADIHISNSFIDTAPVVIVAVALKPEYVMSGGTPAYPVDSAIAIDHITLVAVKEGLGSCWIGGFNQDRIKELLAIPDKYRVALLLSLGYPAESSDRKPRNTRKPLREITSYDRFFEQGKSRRTEVGRKK